MYMKNKKFLFSLPLFTTMILSACGAQHTHAFGEEYVHDENEHWHVCECGEVDGKVPHAWGEGVQTTAPSCTDDGVMTYTCVCGATKTEAITALGHEAATEWQNDETNHWHSCVHDDCYEELNKAAHTWQEDMDQHVDATCTTKGTKVMVCTVCNYSKTEEIQMVAHSWNDGVVTTAPTCTEKGVKTFTCSVCTRTRTEEVDATGHDWESKNSGAAYQFNSNGSWDECKVCHIHKDEVINAKAPWAAFDFQAENAVVVEHEDSAAYDRDTHTLTSSNYHNNDGVRFNIGDIVDETRLVLDITVVVAGGPSWGGQGSFFFFDEMGEGLGSVFCLGDNPFLDAKGIQYRYTALENGVEVKTLSAREAEFTYRFDFRGFEKAPRTFAINGANGVVANPDVITVKSIVAKESLCGHPASETALGSSVASTCKVAGYDEYVCNHEGCDSVEYKIAKEKTAHTEVTETGAETAREYQWAGSRVVCSVCGEILDETNCERAPWAHADLSNVQFTEHAATVSNAAHESSYAVTEEGVSLTGYYNATLTFPIGSESIDRNILSITIKPGAWRWSGPAFYLNVVKTNDEGKEVNKYMHIYNTQGVTDFINAGGKVYTESGVEVEGALTLGQTYRFEMDFATILSGTKISKVQVTADYSDADPSGTYANVPTNLVKDITFKAPGCKHEHTEAFNEPLNCGTRCTDCGEVVTSYVSLVDMSYGSASKQDSYTLTKSVEFDGKTCAQIHQTENLNTSDAGWAQNYKVKFNGILANMKKNGKTKLSIDFYVKSESNFNNRFYWGCGINKDYAWADHYNNVTAMGGTSTYVAEGSVFTQLGTNACGRGNGFYANDWYRLTVDLSNDALQDYGYFFIGGAIGTYPIDIYITNMQVA